MKTDTIKLPAHWAPALINGDAFGEELRQKIKIPYVEFGSHSLEKDYFTKGVEA